MTPGLHTRPTRFASAARTLSLVVLVAVATAACSSGTGDTADQAGSGGPNPGLTFDGRYEVQYLTYDGLPNPPDQPTSTVDARTSCDGDSGPCVTAVAQGPATALLDFRDGSWHGVTANPPVPCTAAGTGQVLGEAPVISRMEVTPQSAGSEVLVADTFTASPDPCTASHTATALLRRIGDADPTVVSPPTDVPARTHAPGMALSGKYYVAATQADKSDQGPDPTFSEIRTFTPLCTRNGERCVAVGTSPGELPVVYDHLDGQWISDFTNPTAQSCTNDPASPMRTTARGHTELTRTDGGADAPAQTLAGLRIWTFDGDCPHTRQFTLQVTRVGD